MTRSARSLSRPWHMTRTAISVRSTFTRLQSFANVQAREFARHPDCSYRSESLFRLPSKSLRVRWLFHRFRSGPQSDSLTPSQDSGNPLGSRGFYFRAYLSSLPPRAADILTVRFGQLTVEGLSPSKIRSLVGCSHGRVEIRRHWSIEQFRDFPGKAAWKDFRSIGMVESERHIGSEVTIDCRYYISQTARR